MRSGLRIFSWEYIFSTPLKNYDCSKPVLNAQKKPKLKKSKLIYLPKKHPFPHSWEAFALKAAKFDNFFKNLQSCIFDIFFKLHFF